MFGCRAKRLKPAPNCAADKKAGDYMPVFHFTDVGRNKQCFTVECRDLDEAARAVMRSGAIRSSSVDLLQPEESHEGIVLVGGYRPVGRFTVEQLN